MIMIPVSFATPIKSGHCLMDAIEQYPWFGGRIVEVIELADGSKGAVEKKETSSCFFTALKLVTMILSLGILPALALTVRLISRMIHTPVLKEVPIDKQLEPNVMEAFYQILIQFDKVLACEPGNQAPQLDVRLIAELMVKSEELNMPLQEYFQSNFAQIRSSFELFGVVTQSCMSFLGIFNWDPNGCQLSLKATELTPLHEMIVRNQCQELYELTTKLDEQILELSLARQNDPSAVSSIDPDLILEVRQKRDSFQHVMKDERFRDLWSQDRFEEFALRCPRFQETYQAEFLNFIY